MKQRLWGHLAMLVLCLTLSLVLLPTEASAADGEVWLGGVNVVANPNGTGPDGGSYSYDATTNTLTLTNYMAKGEHYYSGVVNPRAPQVRAYLYYTTSMLNLNLVGNCQLGEDKNTKEYIVGNDSNKIRTIGIFTQTTDQIQLNINTDGETNGNLTIYSHLWPLYTNTATISAGQITLNCGMDGCILGNLIVNGTADVTAASLLNGRYPYRALWINQGNLIVDDDAKLTVTSYGTAYNKDGREALKADNSIFVDNNGQLIVYSNGSNSGDGGLGRAIYAKNLDIGGNGRVEAYANGKNTKTGKYDGKEAIYVTGTLNAGESAYLYAKTQNESGDNYLGAIYAKNWSITAYDDDGEPNNNTAVITKPENGTVLERDGFVISGNQLKAVKEVELQGIYKTSLLLSQSDGKLVYRYGPSSSTTPGDKTYSGTLDLTKGYGSIWPVDYKGIYSIEVQAGEHTLLLKNFVQERDHAYINVKNGATLNLKLEEHSYLGHSDSTAHPVIWVESGGTLNIIGDEEDPLSTVLTLNGVLYADPGDGNVMGIVNFKNCAVYSFGSIGGWYYNYLSDKSTFANVSVENCLINAKSYLGNLSVKNSTVISTVGNATLSYIGDLKVDPTSNVKLNSFGLLPSVKNWDGTSIYMTTIKLDGMKDSTNKDLIVYRTSTSSVGGAMATFYKITGLRLKNGTTAAKYDDISMLMTDSDETIVLWLPEGTETDSVYGYNHTSGSVAGFVHDRGDGAAIVTKSDHSASGTLVLRDVLMGKGILAFIGTADKDNTRLCADYTPTSTDWIEYEPSKEIKLQSSAPVTGFGLRVLQAYDGDVWYGSKAEVKLNNLHLIGPNKRVQLDMLAQLSLVLMDGTANSMTADANGTDSVLDLSSLSELTIKGETNGSGKLTLAGVRAIKDVGSDIEPGSLNIENCTLINNCSNKSATRLRSLKITNSTVLGLGEINCDSIIIDGGSVDLTVPEGTVVKDSKGNVLKKIVFPTDSSKKDTKVESIVISDLPNGTTFNASNAATDGEGKLHLWIPTEAKLESVTVGGTTYYFKEDGGSTTGEVPVFTSPTADSSVIVEGASVSFSVTATSTPAPSLQWQSSTDGTTWTDIEGATGSTFQLYTSSFMSFAEHGTKYRCVAENVKGRAESPVFTTYYYPPNASIQSSSGLFYFKEDDQATLTPKFKDGDDWRPYSNLTGVTAAYQWAWLNGDNIDGANDASYTLTATSDMHYKRLKCTITLTYPDKTTKTRLLTFTIYVSIKPQLKAQPQSVSIAAGETAAFSVEVNDADSNSFHYQWQSSTDSTTWTDIEGASGAVDYNGLAGYAIPSAAGALNGCWYRCAVWNNLNGVLSYKVYSDPATLTVSSVSIAGNDIGKTYDGTPVQEPDCIETPTDANGEVTFAWYRSDGTALTEAPTKAGGYYVVATLAADDEYKEATDRLDFTIEQVSAYELTAGDIDVTYNGSPIPADKIVGSASFNGSPLAGTWAWKTGEAITNVADSGTKTAVFQPEDSVNYAAAEKEIQVTIRKADPTGTPSYTAITASGKTLQDAELTIGDITPEGGTVVWELGDDQTVMANTAYKWIYTPADTDNYNTLTGSITPYVRYSGGVSTYTITVKDAKNGSVTADRKTASSGATVTLNVKPDQGWTLETLTAASASGNAVDLTIVKVGEKYTFKMPSSNVTVNATFMEDNTILNYFVDVPTNAYYYDAVLWAVEQGITQGTDSLHFSPDGICTRAQAVTFLWRAAGSPTPKSNTMPFTDVPAGSYYYDAVLWAVEQGITVGTSETTFSPNLNCTRAQIVTFLWRSEKSPAAGTVNPFTDVKSDAYYADAVLWAVKQDITKGTSATTFSPDNNCTRAQIVTFLWRTLAE